MILFAWQEFYHRNGSWDFVLLPSIDIGNNLEEHRGLFITLYFACWSFSVGWARRGELPFKTEARR